MKPEDDRRSQSRVALVIASIALLVVSLFAAFEYSAASSLGMSDQTLASSLSQLQSENKNLASTLSGYSVAANSSVVQAVEVHISKLSQRNVQAALLDYASNSTVIWTGTTQGWGGIYNSTYKDVVLRDFFGLPSILNFTMQLPYGVQTGAAVPGTAIALTTIRFGGLSRCVDDFSGLIQASYSLVNQKGVWLITQEDWNFTSFNVTYPSGEGFC